MLNRFKLCAGTDREIFFAAILFFLFMLFFEMFFLNNSYLKYFSYLFASQDRTYELVSILYIALALYCFYNFIVVSFSSKWIYKTIYFLLFTIAVFTEYSYQKSFGRFSEFTDFRSLVATNTEQKISGFFAYLSLLAIVPCAAYLLCLIFVRKREKPQGCKSFATLVLLFGFFFFQLSYWGEIFVEYKFPTASFNAFCRTSTEYVLSDVIFSRSKIRQAVKKPDLPENFRPSNNIIYIVDESIRGDHLSLNGYERETTPFLKDLQRKGFLHNWGIAAAATTASNPTHDVLISGLTPDDLPSKTNLNLSMLGAGTKNLNTSPTLHEYAKAMNYKTYWLDGQMRYYWCGVPDDEKYIDNFVGENRISEERVLEGWEVDREIAQKVKKIISHSTGNFIYVNKRGSHMPYQTNYPAGAETWKPAYNFSNVFEIPSEANYQEVVNSYDNSLKFNIDSFFQNLVDDYSNIPNNTTIIYTGDHGQTFFVGGATAHGGTTKAEATVPLFIIGNLPAEVDTNTRLRMPIFLPPRSI